MIDLPVKSYDPRCTTMHENGRSLILLCIMPASKKGDEKTVMKK